MDFAAISWLGVVLGAIAFFALGALWYGPLLGKPWMRATGMTEDEVREAMGSGAGPGMPFILGATLVLELIAAVGLAAIIGADATIAAGIGTGVAVALLLISTVLAVNMLYERKPVALLGINAAYNVVGFGLMGAIIGALQ